MKTYSYMTVGSTFEAIRSKNVIAMHLAGKNSIHLGICAKVFAKI